MAQSPSAAHLVASRYAAALIDTAEQAGARDSVEKDMADLAAMILSSEDLRMILSSPAFDEAQVSGAVEAITKAANFNALSVNFLKVLAANGRLGALQAILPEFRDELARRRGEVKASVQVAFPLDDAQIRELQGNLSRSLAANVQLDISVDPALLGGMVVTIGSRMIDDSIKTKVERLGQALQTSNQNNFNLKEVG